MSSSPEFSPAAALLPLETPELRTGTWTRLGDKAVLGDAVTEQLLSTLAESTRTAARSQGYAVGWAEGQRAARAVAADEARMAADRERYAEEKRAAEHAAALAVLAEAAARLEESVTEICASVEERASALACDLTTAIIGTATTDLDAVRRALSLAPDGPTTRVLVHPSDVGVVDPATSAALVERGCIVVGDPSLERGDALVEYDDQVLDLRISSALARVQEALR